MTQKAVGIHLAGDPKGTVITTLTQHDDVVSAGIAHVDAADSLVRHFMCMPGAVIGVSGPGGWPQRFADLVGSGRRDQPVHLSDWQERHSGWRQGYTHRVTDLEVERLTGLMPPSAMTLKHGAVAVRFAHLLREINHDIDQHPTTGSVVEVYPPASLSAWSLPQQNLTGAAHHRNLSRAVDMLRMRVPSLILDEQHHPGTEALMRHRVEAFFAAICGLTALAARAGATRKPADLLTVAAAREGWIHLPIGPLSPLDWAHGVNG